MPDGDRGLAVIRDVLINEEDYYSMRGFVEYNADLAERHQGFESLNRVSNQKGELRIHCSLKCVPGSSMVQLSINLSNCFH